MRSSCGRAIATRVAGPRVATEIAARAGLTLHLAWGWRAIGTFASVGLFTLGPFSLGLCQRRALTRTRARRGEGCPGSIVGAGFFFSVSVTMLSG
jgi:hypothetical protein